MDVRCERCKTEYEFDDALVSGRGTTVRCTQCGHQFKVRREEGAGGDPPSLSGVAERWVVTTSAGQTLVHHSLRELQRAILARRVGPADLLSYAGGAPRALGSIAELEPFFSGMALDTNDGGPPAVTGPVHVDTLRPPPAAPAVPRPVVRPASPVGSATTIGFPEPTPPIPFLTPETRAPSPPVHEAPGHSVPLQNGGGDRDAGGSAAQRPLPIRWPEEEGPFSDAAFGSAGGRRRNVGGWIVAVVLLLGVGAVGFVVLRPYVVKPPAASVEQGRDPRIDQHLKDAEKALEDGDLDRAKESLDQAIALADKDPHVLADAARLATTRADIPWLKGRLLPPDAPERAAVGQELEPLAATARARADAALTAAPHDSVAIRAKVDALRILGDRPGARGLASSLATDSPDAAYALAALDLAEPEPLWTTVLDRLRTAARGEGRIGRARAALIYALVRSGDVPGARAELARVAPTHPLLSALRGYVERAEAQPVAPASELAGANAKGKDAGVAEVRGGAEPSDARSSLQLAADAMRKHDLRRAKQLYEGVLARKPADSEALTGLGDVLRAQGNAAGAIQQYRRALAVNPSYLSALVGLADAEWATGDRAGATRLYGDIVDRFPEGTYPAYVKSRTGSAPAPKEPAPKADEGAKTGEPSPAPATESPSTGAGTPTTLPTLPSKEE